MVSKMLHTKNRNLNPSLLQSPRLRTMKDKNSGNLISTRLAIVVNFVIVLVFLLGWNSRTLGWSSTDGEKDSSMLGKKAENGLSTSTDGNIIEGSIGGIPYLHCSPLTPTLATNLVLLHGAAFTKENWRTSGLLDSLCKYYSVAALDLATSSGHQELKRVLDAMKGEKICEIPVNIITPSASGNTIVDWLSDTSELKQYINKWIPVASPAIDRADQGKLKEIGKWLPILAIYGDQDKGGKRLSNILGTYSNAKVVEIPGKHPCYLDSPDLFVSKVQAFL